MTALEDGKPADFTLAEFQEFAQKKPEPWQEMPIEEEEEEPLETIDEGDEDSDSSSDGGEFEAESSSDDDGADDEFEEMMMEKLVADFTRENGRAPTMENYVGCERLPRVQGKESSEDEEEERRGEQRRGPRGVPPVLSKFTRSTAATRRTKNGGYRKTVTRN